MPVDVSVAAIFRAMRPDLPTPETMTRPLARCSSSHRPGELLVQPVGDGRDAARLEAEDAAAELDQRRARQPVTTCRLREVALQHLAPDAARLEQRLDDLPHGAVAARGAGHVARHRPHLADGVRHRDRQADAAQDLEVGEVVADVGDLRPRRGRGARADPPAPASFRGPGTWSSSSTSSSWARSAVASECRPLSQTTGMSAARSSIMPRPSWMSKRLSSTRSPATGPR